MCKNFIEKFEQIYIYGYSNLGRNAYKKLEETYPDKAKGIIVSRHNNKSRQACEKGKLIFELSEVKASNDMLVIIALNPIHQRVVKQALTDAGFENVCIYDDETDNMLNSLLRTLPKLELRFLSVSVGQACNLKCRDCANFAPYALKENRRYHISNIKRDLDKILSCFCEIDTFHIQGGEPFLYSELGELIHYCKSEFGQIVKNFQVATNGTILPSSNLLNALQGGVVVRISNYPNQKNVGELTNILEKNGVLYRMYDFANGVGEWSFTGGMDYVELEDDDDLEEKILNCAWNSCFIVENGLVGRCARSIPARTLQKIHIREQDYIDLSKNYSMSEIGKYFMFIKPMDCCRHCKASNGDSIPPAIQLT